MQCTSLGGGLAFLSFSKKITFLIDLTRDLKASGWMEILLNVFVFGQDVPSWLFIYLFIVLHGIKIHLFIPSTSRKKVLTSQPETTEYMFGTATNRGFPQQHPCMTAPTLSNHSLCGLLHFDVVCPSHCLAGFCPAPEDCCHKPKQDFRGSGA